LVFLLKRKGSRGNPSKFSLIALDVLVEIDVASEIVGEEGVNEYVRLGPGEVGIEGSGIGGGDTCCWYVRCGAKDGATVEGMIDGVLYGFVEEKCWLAK
jgi:hypothetical protein